MGFSKAMLRAASSVLRALGTLAFTVVSSGLLQDS